MSDTATKAKTFPKPEAAPANASNLTFFSPNYSPGLSFAMFPLTGVVTLYFGPGSPSPTSVSIFHQGGTTTPVPPGQGQYQVNAGDYLEIQGVGASCKIQWYYN